MKDMIPLMVSSRQDKLDSTATLELNPYANAGVTVEKAPVLMAVASPLIPRLYKTTDEVRALAAAFIFINAVLIPAKAYMHMCYFFLVN